MGKQACYPYTLTLAEVSKTAEEVYSLESPLFRLWGVWRENAAAPLSSHTLRLRFFKGSEVLFRKRDIRLIHERSVRQFVESRRLQDWLGHVPECTICREIYTW